MSRSARRRSYRGQLGSVYQDGKVPTLDQAGHCLRRLALLLGLVREKDRNCFIFRIALDTYKHELIIIYSSLAQKGVTVTHGGSDGEGYYGSDGKSNREIKRQDRSRNLSCMRQLVSCHSHALEVKVAHINLLVLEGRVHNG